VSAPLSGVLVADFSRVLAGPLTTMWLADLGATVIKVERRDGGDDTRHWGPPWTAGSSTYFCAANRSKLSLALDLAEPDDAELARRRAARADVLVENFRTGVLDQWGLGATTVLATNPGLVYCSITGFGSAQGAGLPGYDFVVQALGGLMSITGDPDGEPSKVGVALVDVLTAKDATIGILSALRARDATGQGQHVEVNLLSSLLGSLANQASSFLATGTSPTRMANRHPSIAPYETLRCGPGLLAVACGNDRQFRRLSALLGVPALAQDARFATNAARVENRTDLVVLLEQALASRPAEEWAAACEAAGIPAGQLGTIGEGFARANELGLEPLVDMPAPHPPQVANPIRFSRSTLRRPTPPPALDASGSALQRLLAEGGPLEEIEGLLGAVAR
jgi:formyl-CoA transferase